MRDGSHSTAFLTLVLDEVLQQFFREDAGSRQIVMIGFQRIECRVKEIMKLGSHDMFIADVVNVLAEESLIDPETGAFDLGAAGLLNYAHGHYFEQGPEIGHFGWSVRKK